jgi:hypothetical protein
MEHLPTSPESLPTSGGIHKSAPRKSRKRNDATGYLFTLFLTHVGNLNTVKLNQRRFAPTLAHIAGIKCPHHWNTHGTSQCRHEAPLKYSSHDLYHECILHQLQNGPTEKRSL